MFPSTMLTSALFSSVGGRYSRVKRILVVFKGTVPGFEVI